MVICIERLIIVANLIRVIGHESGVGGMSIKQQFASEARTSLQWSG